MSNGFHLAADSDSEHALCGRTEVPCVLIECMPVADNLVYCVGCLRVTVAVEEELMRAWFRDTFRASVKRRPKPEKKP